MNQGISASRDIGSTIQFENHKVERWTGDQDFPASYAHGIWGRVAGFFQLPGVVTSSQQGVSVQLHPFHARQDNRDLVLLCQRVNEKQLHLPDGRLLRFLVGSVSVLFSISNNEELPNILRR
jgi:hypothetical protein